VTGDCLSSRAPVLPGLRQTEQNGLSTLYKRRGLNGLHALAGHGRGREGRGWRERITGHKCLRCNELVHVWSCARKSRYSQPRPPCRAWAVAGKSGRPSRPFPGPARLQVAHVLDAWLAASDLYDDLLRHARFEVVAEENLPVDALVRAFLLFDGPRAHQAQRPPLELKLVLLGQDVRLVGRDGFADGDDLGLLAAGAAQPVRRRRPAKGRLPPAERPARYRQLQPSRHPERGCQREG